MQRKKSNSPATPRVKGIFIFHEKQGEDSKLLKLMPTLDCEILMNHNNRMMVKATLENFQLIKKCWLANDPKNEISQELHNCVRQIIIGGNS